MLVRIQDQCIDRKQRFSVAGIQMPVAGNGRECSQSHGPIGAFGQTPVGLTVLAWFALSSLLRIVSQTRNQCRLIVAQQPLRLCALFVQVVEARYEFEIAGRREEQLAAGGKLVFAVEFTTGGNVSDVAVDR